MTRSTAAGTDGALKSEIDLPFSKIGIGVVVYVIVVTGRAVVGDDDDNENDDADDDGIIVGINGDGVVDVNGRLFVETTKKKKTKSGISH